MKKFGLIKVGAKAAKKGPAPILKPSVFGMGGDDSDEDDSAQALKPVATTIVDYSKQSASAIADYSFEPGQKQETKEVASSRVQVEEPEYKASYIEGMKAKADVRSKERERASDKRIIKEREKEDEQYGDQPKFITSAYKAKLVEDARFDEDEKARDHEDDNRTHTTQGMQGFYAGLMTGNVSTGQAGK